MDLQVLFSWNDGSFGDLWILVHLLWGMILGIAFLYTKLSFNKSLLLSTLLILAWEIVEIVFNIGESWANVTTDIFVGIAGFVSSYLYFSKTKHKLYIFSLIIILALILPLLGWMNYLSR